MDFNIPGIKPLVDDEFVGEPAKRALQYLQSKRQQGHPVVGIYCGYAPMEIIRAMGAGVAVLCAFSDKTIGAAEVTLPSNLCPLIKSSYGFILTDTCPFYGFSDVVVAETTCDGKKKMFELIRHLKPIHVMDLPQLPDEQEAEGNWSAMIRKLKAFLEEHLGRQATDKDIEAAIKDTNKKNRIMNAVFDFAACNPPVMNWKEIYDLTFLAVPASATDIDRLFQESLSRLEQRVKDGVYYGKKGAPRVLVTGCPVAGDATKVFNIIEQAGGVIVAIDSCTGMKGFMGEIEEDTGDPIAAIARRYLKIPCACMTPNLRRLSEMDKWIERFKPDVIIDVVLHACHGYNVESHKLMKYVTEKKIPFLKIETDYSATDVGQIRTRVEALFETLHGPK